MILYKVLRYKILDFCLDMLFEGLQLNFDAFNARIIQAKDLKTGMFFKKIERVRDGSWYLNARVKDIGMRYSEAMGREYMYVHLIATYSGHPYDISRRIEAVTFPIYLEELLKIYE